MSWPNQFNICDERTAYVDLTKSDAPDVMWTDPGSYGDSRRKKLKPETLSVEWRRDFRKPEWKIWRVSISGPYLHKTASYSLSLYFQGGGHKDREVEPWMEPLIAATHPDARNP